ncbi:hypothetical protein [Pseudocnuella soli]|uniref:hypothetical protein n=1 Tax=Pseudocnuella soli TaxID=2502779 RepID=UPI0014046779|nr:hypothetical protein [Pseudocnuella soli]
MPQVIRYKTINHLLSKEFRNATRAAPPDDHITFYQNPEIFAQLLQRFLQANAKEQ